jgi:hypothetical protein
MSDAIPLAFARPIRHLESCLFILEQAAIPSYDLDVLQTFLTHAKGYLSKDLSPATDALENWETPENQAMIQRFITHVEQEIRLVVEEWQQTHPDEAHTPLGAQLNEMLVGLEQGLHGPTGANEPWPPDAAANGRS